MEEGRFNIRAPKREIEALQEMAVERGQHATFIIRQALNVDRILWNEAKRGYVPVLRHLENGDLRELILPEHYVAAVEATKDN